jgi:hypothetical protein
VSDPNRHHLGKTAIIWGKPPSSGENRHHLGKTAIIWGKTTGQREHQRWYGHGTPCPCKNGWHFRSPPHKNDVSASIYFFLP